MVEKGEKAIEIGRLQRFAVDHVLDRNIRLFQAGEAEWAPRGLHRFGACVPGVRGASCAEGLRRDRI